MDKVYSYHTFILPFIWEGQDHTSKTMKKISKCFSDNLNWLSCDIKNNDFKSISKIPQMDERSFYAEHQYFHPAVRKAIYGYDNNIVTNYIFKPTMNNNSQYIIKKNDLEYSIDISAIKLKIFNTGIATLIIECKNCKYKSIADVKNINDYGRRIAVPYIPDDASACVCADYLAIKINDSLIFEENFKKDFIDKTNSSKDFSGISLDHIADFIKQILGYGSDIKFTSVPTKDKKSIYIYSALDDRMFVACLVADEELANEYCNYKNDINTEKSLYELAFCDRDGDLTCQSSQMRKERLETCVYDRWAEYETLYTFTPQAMICVMSDFEPLINSFLTQYTQICILCLVQRASLINFQDEALDLTKDIETRGKAINSKTVAKLMNLQERFIAFQSQLNFYEISSQEQAVDIYTIIKTNFFVDKHNNELKEQLDLLYSAANINLDFGFNKGAMILALIALVVSLPNYFCFVSPNAILSANIFTYTGILVGAIALIIVITKIIYRRNK